MNLRGVDLNLLTVFEAAYEERSQIKAAERIGMTQPAISNALGRLKHIAKDPLFTGKSSAGLQPTPRADEIYDQIHQALNLVRAGLTNDIEFEPADSHRHFSLSICYGGGSVIGPALYRNVNREAPNARLSIYSIDPEKEATAMLRDHSLDILVHYNKYADPGLMHELIYQHQPVIIARREHPRIGEMFTPEQALQERFAIVFGHFPTLSVISEQENWFDQVYDRIALQVPNVMVLLLAVAQTDLLALTTQQIAHTFKNLFDIKCYPVPWQIERVPLYMIWHRSAQADPAHRWLREKVKESIRHTWIPPIDQREYITQEWIFRHDTFTQQRHVQ
ncbi:LysR family transcriptional regulator [Candidatus Methylospira mobilis]|uniref:LysR family transcriptional regulator n=1 Tax=Candidatus Methylospira mobilis TaxID=1808979 RepID=A0A5Q0BN58_9GAMM|nr:LysR substrate-binding domain-containing protein [Candidatus Methylospira mobilis]QFY43186.1 LysR family transcriptional regulator [Candidatus Methylospira mobilis]WNV03611.1 LysR substrate-binding domain-containing protein [Candidatus Methylospira mobilis]